MRVVYSLYLFGGISQFARSDVCQLLASRAGIEPENTVCGDDGICQNILRASDQGAQLIDLVLTQGEPITCDEAASWLNSNRRFKRRALEQGNNFRAVRPTSPEVSEYVSEESARLESIGARIEDIITPLTVSFPFVHLEQAAEMFASLEEDLSDSLDQEAEDGNDLEGGLRVFVEKVVRLEDGIQYMLATIVNDPGADIPDGLLVFVGECLMLLQRIYDFLHDDSTLKSKFGPSFDQVAALLIPLGFEDLDADEPIPPMKLVARALTRMHRVCAVCDAGDLIGLGDSISEAIANHTGAGDDRSLMQHAMMYLLALGASLQTGASLESRVCTVHANNVFDVMGPRLSSNWQLRQAALRVIRFCGDWTHLFASLLHRSANSVGTAHSDSVITVDQSLAPSAFLDSVMAQIAPLRKPDLTHDDPWILQVRYIGSDAVGYGPIKNLIARVIPAVVASSYGLFIQTAGGNAVPNPSGSVDKFRSLGQLLGIAHTMGIVAGLPLADSVLHLMRMIRAGRIELKDILSFVEASEENLDQLLTNHTTDFTFKNEMIQHGDLAMYLKTPFDLEEGRSLDNDSPGERRAFLIDQAKSDTIVSTYRQVRAMIEGFYDVRPFPMLSYFDMPYLVDAFTARGVLINRSDLKLSASYGKAGGPEGAVAVTPDEAMLDESIQWFWEIIDELSETEMAGFLNFVSGSKYPPIGGFRGVDGDKKWLMITYNAEGKDFLPVANTCFQGLILTPFSSKEVMRTNILRMSTYDEFDSRE